MVEILKNAFIASADVSKESNAVWITFIIIFLVAHFVKSLFALGTIEKLCKDITGSKLNVLESRIGFVFFMVTIMLISANSISILTIIIMGLIHKLGVKILLLSSLYILSTIWLIVLGSAAEDENHSTVGLNKSYMHLAFKLHLDQYPLTFKRYLIKKSISNSFKNYVERFPSTK